MTMDKLIAELDQALQFPGIANAWTMPIKARIDMLSTGIRTPIGIKVYGKDLAEIERVAKEVESVVKTVPGTTSAYAERLTGGYYVEIEPDRMALARYGIPAQQVLDLVESLGCHSGMGAFYSRNYSSNGCSLGGHTKRVRPISSSPDARTVRGVPSATVFGQSGRTLNERPNTELHLARPAIRFPTGTGENPSRPTQLQ
jgi:Cu(I)/Ag(I) efflux system membrane protein CusA/SilA